MHHILIVEARYYEPVADLLIQGAINEIEAHGATYERIAVPGAFDIPAAIRFALSKERYDGYVALGCVIRGETSHYDIVVSESARGLIDLSLDHQVAIGNGILTVDNEQQATERADPKKRNIGAHAVRSALRLIELKNYFTHKSKLF